MVTITKVLEPADDPGRFDLNIGADQASPVRVLANAGAGQQKTDAEFEFSIADSVANFTVSESIGDASPAGSSLADYDTRIECVTKVETPGAGFTEMLPHTGEGPVLAFGVTVFSDQVITNIVCIITNVRIAEGEPMPGDKDGDGLSDAAGADLGTDPCNPDTDGDGRNDADELFIDQTNPRDPLNTPTPIAPRSPAPGTFFPTPTLDRELTILGGGPLRELQGSLNDLGLGYQSATFTLENGQVVTLPADPTSPGMFSFFTAFDDFDADGLGPDSDFDPFLDREIPFCTPTLLDTTPILIFADGFESGDTSAWSSIGP